MEKEIKKNVINLSKEGDAEYVSGMIHIVYNMLDKAIDSKQVDTMQDTLDHVMRILEELTEGLDNGAEEQ